MELNETTLEQILTRQREEFRHYMGVPVEGLRSEIQTVAEGVFGLQENLDALTKMVAKNTEDIELIKTDIEIMKADRAIIRRDLKEKVGRDELAVLEARVAVLERSGRARS